MKKNFVLFCFLLLFLIVIYLFWGPLFPWNPIKIGYTTIKSDKGKIFINNKTKSDVDSLILENIVKNEEKFHNLKYLKNFKVVVLTKQSKMKRYLPMLKGEGYSISISNLNLIYVGPNAIKQNKIEEYLKHEMSHLLIGQNASAENKKIFHNQGWFVEGIAEYFSGHRFYNSDQFSYFFKSNLDEYKTIVEKNPFKIEKQELEFFYSYYGYFIEHLVNKYGLEKLQLFLNKYIKNPKDYKDIFKKIYGESINKAVNDFNLSFKP